MGQVKNPDVSDLVNTIDKMAQKRAFVAAILIATNASDYFTQDMEDFNGEVVEGHYTEQPPMTLEEAENMETAQGTRYGDISTADLIASAEALSKKERDPKQERKLLAMSLIVKARNEPQPA